MVTQLSEGVARVAWSDIADQFPAHLVGLSKAEIAEHLGDGLRLPLDEVISQFPQELFVADTPEVEIHGLHRIPVPFHPMEESDTPSEAAPVIPAGAGDHTRAGDQADAAAGGAARPRAGPARGPVVGGAAARGASGAGGDRASRRTRGDRAAAAGGAAA